MSSPIESTWAHSTVLLERATGGRGTGFLVGRPLVEDRWRLFLITNKHVLSPDPAIRQSMTSIGLHVNVLKNGVVAGEKVDYPLEDASGKWWREHPDAGIDVLAIDAIPLFSARKDLANKFVPEELFAPAAKRKELDVTAGEEIITVGYPSGLRQGKTNAPLIRQGIIATRIGEELHEEIPQPGGGVSIRKSRAFLIDGATIPGSSGSPVVLKPVTGRFQGNNIMMGGAPPVLLGIIAETRFAPIQTTGGPVLGFAGLGFAFDVETVIEVMNLF